MIRHKKIQIQLYDYLQNALPESDRKIVENHLRSCEVCKRSVEDVKKVIDKFESVTAPADERNAEYWNNFAMSVERKIHTRRNKLIVSNIIDQLYSLFVINKKTTIAFSTAMILIFVVGLWYTNELRTIKSPAYRSSAENQDTILVEKRVGDYFRKSKTLLVGLTNLEVDQGQSLDLNTEQNISRELINESRNLRRQPIDIRSAELIGDMENLLVNFSEIGSRTNHPEFENIRQKIYRDNLLFKIRMAEFEFSEAMQSRLKIHPKNKIP
ncbi:MAG: zf-HC2 domain-containing protein [Ignavibacteriales bacterium]|nr:zf-HC2 domain-containing protein [Ignavibacteriales bacterium]